MDEEKPNNYALIGFLTASNSLSSRISGFSEKEKGWLDRCAGDFLKNGKSPVVVSLGNNRPVNCSVIILRLLEIAEEEGVYGLKVIHKFLYGAKEPIDEKALIAAFYALKKIREELKNY